MSERNCETCARHNWKEQNDCFFSLDCKFPVLEVLTGMFPEWLINEFPETISIEVFKCKDTGIIDTRSGYKITNCPAWKERKEND